MMSRVNPFKELYEVCNQGNSRKKLSRLPSFPRYLDIELTNQCNFKCLMCPTGVGSALRSKGFMSDEIFRRIRAEIAQYKTPVRLIRWGEPLLHHHLVEYVKDLKRGGSLVHINTNGSLLDEKMIDHLLEAELDSIKFSFQGLDKTSYREMRNIDFLMTV